MKIMDDQSTLMTKSNFYSFFLAHDELSQRIETFMQPPQHWLTTTIKRIQKGCFRA